MLVPVLSSAFRTPPLSRVLISQQFSDLNVAVSLRSSGFLFNDHILSEIHFVTYYLVPLVLSSGCPPHAKSVHRQYLPSGMDGNEEKFHWL